MFDKILNTLGTRILNAVINLTIAIVLSNYLGADGKGEQGLIIATISIVVLFTGIIGPASLVFHIPRYSNEFLILASYVWLIFSSIGIYCFLYFSNIVPQPYILDVCLLSIILSITSINLSILIANQRIKDNNRLNNIQTITTLLVLIGCFLFFPKPTINHYLISVYSGYIVGLIFSFAFTYKSYDFSGIRNIQNWKTPLKSMFFLGIFNQLAIFTQMLSFRLSYYILNKHFGTESVGVYSNGVSIAESIWIISRSIALVQSSVIVNSVDNDYSVKLTKTLLWINFVVSAFCIIPLLVLPASFYIWVFGRDFGEIVNVIRVLAPGILFFGIVLIIGHYFSATGKHYYNTIASSSGLAITVILSYLLIPRWNIYGAGIASSVSYLFTAGVVIYFFIRKTKGSNATFIPTKSDLYQIIGLFKERFITKNQYK